MGWVKFSHYKYLFESDVSRFNELHLIDWEIAIVLHFGV